LAFFLIGYSGLERTAGFASCEYSDARRTAENSQNWEAEGAAFGKMYGAIYRAERCQLFIWVILGVAAMLEVADVLVRPRGCKVLSVKA
jgi:hypothetical protein